MQVTVQQRLRPVEKFLAEACRGGLERTVAAQPGDERISGAPRTIIVAMAWTAS
jgi:hypothetical protein